MVKQEVRKGAAHTENVPNPLSFRLVLAFFVRKQRG